MRTRAEQTQATIPWSTIPYLSSKAFQDDSA